MTSVAVVEPGHSLRLAEIGELTALSYLADQLVETNHPYVAQLRDAPARARDAVLLMAVDGDSGEGAAVGTLTVVPPATPFSEIARDEEWELRMLAVSPLARGRGLGEQLTLAGLEYAIEHGAQRVVLSTMETMLAAHRLYERLGFSRLPDRDWVVYDGEDGSVVKQLPEEAAKAPACATPGVKLLAYVWNSPEWGGDKVAPAPEV